MDPTDLDTGIPVPDELDLVSDSVEEPGSAEDVERLLAGRFFTVGSGGTVSCTLAQLAAGGSATFTLTVRTDAAFLGPLVNTASANASTSDPSSSNNAPRSGPA